LYQPHQQASGPGLRDPTRRFDQRAINLERQRDQVLEDEPRLPDVLRTQRVAPLPFAQASGPRAAART
jgi:hypothetical protein